MDWQVLQDGLKAWFALASGLAAPTIAWTGEAEVHRAYPQADLQLLQHATEPGTDELRYETDDLTGQLVPVVIGNRTATFMITLRSRDQRAPGKAYTVLDSVRTKLALPAAIEAFDALDVTVRDTSTVADQGGFTQGGTAARAVTELRELSAASLSITLAYTVLERDADHAFEPIESVELGGTVNDTITVPDQVIP